MMMMGTGRIKAELGGWWSSDDDVYGSEERGGAAVSVSAEPEMEAVDELQALNTALCFLVSINADSGVVRRFVSRHPESLLLEGTGDSRDESATSILLAQLRQCACFSPLCRQNRESVRRILDRGFEHYSLRRIQMEDRRVAANADDPLDDLYGSGDDGGSFLSPSLWSDTSAYGHRLRKLERHVRVARRSELRLRHRILEATIQVRELDGHLSRCLADAAAAERSLVAPDDSSAVRSPSAKTIWALCAPRRPADADPSSPMHAPRLECRARCSAAEYQLRMARLNLASLERERAEQLRCVRSARRLQFGLLKRAFEGCRRHVCLASSSSSAPPYRKKSLPHPLAPLPFCGAPLEI
jgi:hypothetical protein